MLRMDAALGRLCVFISQVMKVRNSSGEPLQLADFMPWAANPPSEQPASIEDAFGLLRSIAASNKRKK